MATRERSITRELKLHAYLLATLLLTMWALEIADVFVLGGALDAFGIRPRDREGLPGILFAPFLHGGFGHLMANTVPYLIFGWLILLHGFRDFFTVLLLSIVVAGLGTWLIGAENSVHIGASGEVFAFFGFLLLRGWFHRSFGSILLSVAIFLAYGGLLFGVLPNQPHISWEGHLFGFLAGGAAAWALAKVDRRQALRSAREPVALSGA